jgi:starch synthase (maltosyl-transferring)
LAKPADGKKRVVVEGVKPQIDGGRYAIKRVVGDSVRVEADIFADGHDLVACRLLHQAEGEREWQSAEMESLGNDHWRGEFPVSEIGFHRYVVAGTIDHFGSWRRDLVKRLDAKQDVGLDLRTGAMIIRQAAARAKGEDAARLAAWAKTLEEKSGDPKTTEVALDADLAAMMSRYRDPELETRHAELKVFVDRERARFSSWYEFFPRSCGASASVHGTFKDCDARLEYAAAMGFDVVYFPPIHPVGRSYRKGRNNAVEAKPGDVGSPWAIGAEEGGHTAIHPELGTLADFRALIGKTRDLGMEIALDIAFQCAPDHPWVKEHPEWFRKRADGSIQYAENPPKKYQDIYPFDFESHDWQGLWDALLGVFLFWIDEGVKIFRVDNPHTKAFPFWEWAIGEIKEHHPDVLFLAEAFTRPRVMERLAKLGYTQSYTYFTWRNTKQELTQYMRELTETEVKEYFRPNFWPNTPDILPEALQVGGAAAFKNRLILAATLSSNYGMYGPAFELLESKPRDAGGEEYLDSEKYELKQWDVDSPASLRPLIQRVNQIRRENPALQVTEGIRFHQTDNPQLICYSKTGADGRNPVLVVVNIDPYHTQSGWVDVDLDALGVNASEPFQVYDQLSDARYLWQGARNFVMLSPDAIPAHIFRVLKRVRSEKDFDYYL